MHLMLAQPVYFMAISNMYIFRFSASAKQKLKFFSIVFPQKDPGDDPSGLRLNLFQESRLIFVYNHF
jgi:hypothetical protein